MLLGISWYFVNFQATPTLAAAYSISRAVKIPVMCSSGLSAVTAPMAITAGAAGVVCSSFHCLSIPQQLCPVFITWKKATL